MVGRAALPTPKPPRPCATRTCHHLCEQPRDVLGAAPRQPRRRQRQQRPRADVGVARAAVAAVVAAIAPAEARVASLLGAPEALYALHGGGGGRGRTCLPINRNSAGGHATAAAGTRRCWGQGSRRRAWGPSCGKEASRQTSRTMPNPAPARRGCALRAPRRSGAAPAQSTSWCGFDEHNTAGVWGQSPSRKHSQKRL